MFNSSSVAKGGSLTHAITITPISANHPSACQASSGSGAYDVWNPPASVGYESGKHLQSLVTYHFAASNLSQSNNALEKYFFTREYGFTRWEAWIPLSRCHSQYGSTSTTCTPNVAANFLYGRCSPNVSPSTTTFGNQTWVRVDCRDSTNYIALSTPQIMVNADMAANDGLVDILGFATSVSSQTPLPGGLSFSPGQSVSSGTWLFGLQGDGNLVLYNGSTPYWASGTNGKCSTSCRAIFQGDGNLVIYSGSTAVWASNTVGATSLNIYSQPPYVSETGSPTVQNPAPPVTTPVVPPVVKPPVAPTALPSGTYQQSCSACHLSGNLLTCSCLNTASRRVSTTLNLLTCPVGDGVWNKNGALACD